MQAVNVDFLLSGTEMNWKVLIALLSNLRPEDPR